MSYANLQHIFRRALSGPNGPINQQDEQATASHAQSSTVPRTEHAIDSALLSAQTHGSSSLTPSDQHGHNHSQHYTTSHGSNSNNFSLMHGHHHAQSHGHSHNHRHGHHHSHAHAHPNCSEHSCNAPVNMAQANNVAPQQETLIPPSGHQSESMDVFQDDDPEWDGDSESDEERGEEHEDEHDEERCETDEGETESQGDDQSAQDKEGEAKAQQHQTEMRKRIVMIQSDPTINPIDKAKKIQELMTQGWQQKQATRISKETRVTNKLENRRNNFNELTDADRQPTYHDKALGTLGCRHYQRAAKLQAHCCGKWDTCRFCHDEVSDHNIVRNLITTMMCMYCSTVQPAGQVCINGQCKEKVAEYYCKECKLWDSDPRKNIYHCYDCGICRIGKGLGIDYFHCKKCNVCMAISLMGRHKCIERNLESDCPICGEYMFTSTTTVIFMPCGHCIHYKCHQEYIQTSYQCPTCLKSLADMKDYFHRIDQALAQQQMPVEYSNLYNQVYCNDCEKKCYAKFHFMYHKCVSCQGYNTKVFQTLESQHVPPEALKLLRSTPQAEVPALPTSPATATNVSTPDIFSDEQNQEIEQQRRRSVQAASVNLLGSSTTSINSYGRQSRRASAVTPLNYWCHSCQGTTTPTMSGNTQRCGTCGSDFLEQM